MSKIFGTDGIRCLVNEEPLTAEMCLKISKSVSFILRKKNNQSSRVVICKDTRLSGYLYEPLVTAGFISMGMDVILVGPLPTPAVPLMIKTLRADIGVMITASHNTYEYNGLKFFDHHGRKLDKKIEEKVESIVLNKKKLKIILDCGNGATYNIAPDLFWELGHEVKTINVNPNGKNINKNCGAVDTRQLSNIVLKEKANIGFAFDGDGDRIIVIDENGKEIDGDKIIALFSKKFIKPKNKINQIDVIITVMSNMALENYLSNKLKLKIKRTDVGDINVINCMRKYKSLLGGEQSGHIILSNFSNTGDGILAALKITEIMISCKSKASKLFNLYSDYHQEKLNLRYKTKNENLIKIINSLNKNKLFNNNKLRSLIRLSGTEPLVRILVEGKNAKLVKQNLAKIKNLLRTHLG